MRPFGYFSANSRTEIEFDWNLISIPLNSQWPRTYTTYTSTCYLTGLKWRLSSVTEEWLQIMIDQPQSPPFSNLLSLICIAQLSFTAVTHVEMRGSAISQAFTGCVQQAPQRGCYGQAFWVCSMHCHSSPLITAPSDWWPSDSVPQIQNSSSTPICSSPLAWEMGLSLR